MDQRSLWLNFEISLFVYSSEFTSRLKTLHDGYLADSELIDLNVWRERPFRRRFLENSARLIGPLL